MSSIRLALATLALAAAVGAQSHPVLTINGEAHASVPLNRTMDIHLVANAGSTAFGLFNIDPGPTPFLNTTIPISIGPNLLIGFQSFVMPPSGDHHFTLPIAQNAALEGVKVYAFVLTFDNALPQGFGLSNGADFVLVREPSAGPDTIALTGHGVTLDGSSNHAATLPAGQTLQWSVTNGPVGHAATLGGANTEFPTLNADLPGLYDVELSLLAPGSTGGATDTVQIEVFELQSLSHQHGDFDLADPIAFSANLAGPPASAFELVGIASGTTSVSGNVAAGNPVTDLLLKVQGANGQTIRRPVTIVNNVGASMVTPPLDSFAAYLGQPIIDEVEMLLETALSAVNLSGPLTGIPSIPVATIPGPFGTTLFSADVTPTSFSYDPMVLVDLTLNAGSAHGQITLNNVAFGFDISGLLFNAAYMDMGTLASTSVVIDFDFALSVVNGAWVTTVSNETAMVNGATLTFVGGIIPAAFTSGLAGTIVPLIEPLFATAIPALIPPVIDGILAIIPPVLDLSASGVNLALDFQPNSANHSVGGLALHFDGGAHATVLAPGAATLPAYFSTPSMSPSFNGLVPSSMAPYRLALAVSDDALNQLLAASLEAGVLDQRLVGGLTVAGMPFAADAGSLALAAPGLGFEKFDPAAPIIIQLHAGVAPVARVATSGNDLLQLAVSGLEVDFRVEVVPGYEISALRVAISGDLGANVTFNAMAGTLDITAGSIMTQVDGLDSLPGVDPAASLVALNGLVSALVPSLLTGLQGIPVSGLLPTAVPLALAGIEAAGPSGDFVAIYLD